MKLKKGDMIVCTRNAEIDNWWEFTVGKGYRVETIPSGKLGVYANKNHPIEATFFEYHFFPPRRDKAFLAFKLISSDKEEIE